MKSVKNNKDGAVMALFMLIFILLMIFMAMSDCQSQNNFIDTSVSQTFDSSKSSDTDDTAVISILETAHE